jgi:hypothetical protein
VRRVKVRVLVLSFILGPIWAIFSLVLLWFTTVVGALRGWASGQPPAWELIIAAPTAISIQVVHSSSLAGLVLLPSIIGSIVIALLLSIHAWLKRDS